MVEIRHSFIMETDSLIIREFTLEDLAGLRELTWQSEITDVLPDWRMSEEQLNQFLSFVISSYENFDPDHVRFLLALEHKQGRRLIGWCGVFPNDLLPPAEREIAYAVSKDYRNRGYVSEAVRAVAAHVFECTSLGEIVAIVKPFNAPSRRVVEKAGFEHRRRVTLSDQCEYDYFILSKAKERR
ncbi:GNAT family N-acetyltransferase [Paenibacillus elgii]|uniref:N-acetyltransferase domain-containing protein n=1 Tax=Paenibacillus elgii TaxID=189691 RepID=A0A163VSR5_9BACL|nr:GNAT family N-acetyltransferase [Paenibacillus elgii]KZE75336.1 hypothetical protein AV654_26565 [Paenibacillus elgii]NEN87336.1 GNAT family N-acetyltransferase [Paenibacillus elgii]